MAYMENARLGAGAVTAGEPDAHHNPRTFTLQATLDRAWRHEFTAEALGALLALRLDWPRCFLLATGGLMALPPEDREAVAATVLSDLRAGRPVPAFSGIREEARLWAAFASPAERRAYAAAIWGQLPESDRRGFLRAVRRPA